MPRLSVPSVVVPLLLSLLLLGGPGASAQTASTSLPGISVIGSGQASAPAETASVVLMLASGFYEDSKAMQPAITPSTSPDESARPVVDAIVGAGVAAEDIQIMDNPYSGDYGPGGGPTTVTLRFDIDQPTIDGIRQILDVALPAARDSGWYVNMIGVTYGVADCATLEQQARQDAIADARGQAAIQAGLLNVSLGQVTASRDDPYSSLIYGAYGGYSAVNSCTMQIPATSMAAIYSAPAFDPGLPAEVTVTASVELTFEILAEATPAP